MKTEYVSINDIIEIIIEKLSLDGQVKLKVTGNSMYPFLKNREDFVTLNKPNSKFRKGDIVLFNYQGNWTLHRIVKIKDEHLTICGDALKRYEFTTKDQVVAIVGKINKNNKEILVSNKLYRFKVKVWLILKPFRRYLLWFLRKNKF